jgi:hypothetical protein
MFIDDCLPTYDVSDSVATVVNADVATTWSALMEVDLVDVGRQRRAVGMLAALRALPEVVTRLLHGESLPSAPDHLRLRDSAKVPPALGGWVLLYERPNEEIALGIVGKFWLPVIEYATVSRESFRDFAQPGYAKAVYALAVRPLDGDRTLLTGVMRTATTGASGEGCSARCHRVRHARRRIPDHPERRARTEKLSHSARGADDAREMGTVAHRVAAGLPARAQSVVDSGRCDDGYLLGDRRVRTAARADGSGVRDRSRPLRSDIGRVQAACAVGRV